jgi:hypothetical protein
VKPRDAIGEAVARIDRPANGSDTVCLLGQCVLLTRRLAHFQADHVGGSTGAPRRDFGAGASKFN